MRVAVPRNTKNPVMSVIVVKRIEEAVAGSLLSRVNTIGTSAPAIPAAKRERIMAQKACPAVA